jgi:protein-L-isoaspartate(D-aspartate) O-methyltransferase
VELMFEQARSNMIKQQIQPWEMSDERVLAVMMSIPREQFVPDAYRGLAYADIEVPLSGGQAMMAPRLVARMLQALAIQPTDRVLEIGTGSGYATACLAAQAREVVSLEIDEALLTEARGNLAKLAVRNVDLRSGDALTGPIEGAPFNVIAATGSLPSAAALPDLQMQLETGGRLFVVVGEAPAMEALLITCLGRQSFRRESLFETVLPALRNAPLPERFVF